MSWTATLCIAHGPGEEIAFLTEALHREGWRLIPWDLSRAAPAGAMEADLIIVSAGLTASADRESGPFPGAGPKALTLALGTGDAPWASAVLSASDDIKRLKDRAGALLRLVRLEDECRLRATTLTELGAGPLDEKGLKPPASARVLHIGGPTLAFAGLHAALDAYNIDLRPVLSAGLALDEMEAGLVDAVVLDASASDQTVRELSLIMRRNSDLALCPLLLLDPKQGSMKRHALVGDVINNRAEDSIVGIRLSQLIAENRRRRRALALLGRSRVRGLHDARTGLHNPQFVNHHMCTLAAEQAATGRSFSIGVLRLSPLDNVLSPEDSVSLAQQTGSLVARLIRAEDSAAALSDNIIAVLFPATLEAEAQIALRRIAAVLTATRYNAARSATGIEGVVDWLVGTPGPDRPYLNLFSDLQAGIGSHLKSAV